MDHRVADCTEPDTRGEKGVFSQLVIRQCFCGYVDLEWVAEIGVVAALVLWYVVGGGSTTVATWTTSNDETWQKKGKGTIIFIFVDIEKDNFNIEHVNIFSFVNCNQPGG